MRQGRARGRPWHWLLPLFIAAAAPAAAAPAGPGEFPTEQVRALGPLLRQADTALLEADETGAMKRITVMSLAAAPPDLVRDVVVHPERYPEFVRNMKVSTVQRRADGSLDHTYELNYSIIHLDGISRYKSLPPGPEGGPQQVEMYDPNPGGLRHHRWAFVPYAGGTIVVLSGYTDVHTDGLLARLNARVPTLEYGLALIAQMTLLRAMKNRAEQLAGPAGRLLPGPAETPRYDSLLDRGTLAFLRSSGGRLSETTLITRVQAPAQKLLATVSQPARWSDFVPSITRSVDAGQREGVPAVELEQSIPLLSFRTVFGLLISGGAVDMLGLSGDLRGGRLRWDVRPAGKDGSELVLRTSLAYDRASVIIRQLYKAEPLFEYGVNVGLGLVILQGIKAQAMK